jgi:uncharacterized protein (TIGR02246 family)
MTARVLQTAILFFALITARPAFAQGVPAADEQAIRARLAAYADARMQRDAHKEALCYTEGGDFRSSAGPFVRGRAAIEKQLTVNDPTYQFILNVVSLRTIQPGVVVVEADLMTGVGGKLGNLVGTYVMAKQNGEWLIDAARIARAMPTAATR